MSIAQTQAGGREPRGARSEPTAIGALLGNLPRMEADQLGRIEHVPHAAEQARHSAQVHTMMRQFPLVGDELVGKRRKQRILDVIETFSRRPPVTVDVPPIVWTYLYAVGAKIAAQNVDWDSECGPLIAASNAHLKRAIGWNAARNNLARLAEYGLVVPYCLAGNGKRYLGSRSKGETPDASGWSLAPLLLLEDYLVELEQVEDMLADQHMILPKEIRRSTSSAYRLLRAFEGPSAEADRARKKLDAIAAARRTFQRRKASLEAVSVLRRLSQTAERHLERITQRLAGGKTGQLTDENDTRVQPNQHHLYSPNSIPVPVDGLAERRSGDEIAIPSNSAKGESSEKEEGKEWDRSDVEDPYGIERSGFHWDETPTLFPFISGLVDFDGHPGLDELHAVARMSRIAQPTAARASGQLGTQVALLCALITGHHLFEGEIRKTPDAYMNALVKRARNGELNIGHTLFGRREAVFGRRDTKASKQVNHMQGSPW
tara:strand:- start:6818 stop:8284 length:1467 start_codon:yes stop_codon:yes gene_type:complete